MITIKDKNGTKQIQTPDYWNNMAPIARVLWIHENHRDITDGQKFEIVK